MTKFVELFNENDQPFLFDFVSGWEVIKRDDGKAHFQNSELARNLSCNMTYSDVKTSLIMAKLL